MAKSRIFLLLLVAFAAGVGVRSFIALPYLAIESLALVAVIVIVVSLLRGYRAYMVYGCLLLALFGGVMRYEAAERAAPDLSGLYGKMFRVQGVATADPVAQGTYQRIKLKILSVNGHAAEPHFSALATLRRLPAYRIGDEFRMEGVIERPENYGDFDYVSHLRRDGIFALIAFPAVEKIGEGQGNRLMRALSRVKHAFEKNIDTALPEPHAAFMKGLLLGERASLPKTMTEQFKQTGVSHIVALSGYNITLVGRSFMNGLLRITIPFPLAFWIAVVAIILFVFMTGAAASVVRAGIMGLLVLLAQKEGRAYHMTNALVFAGAAMVFHNPYILRFDAGFQLSFLATAGLVYLAPAVERWLGRVWRRNYFSDEGARRREKNRLLRLRETLVETLSAQIMVLPLLIYLFGSVSLISPLANIASLIAVPYAMGAGFVAALAAFLTPALGRLLGWIAWLLLEYILSVTRFFAAFPYASVEVGAWAGIFVAALYGSVAWCLSRKSSATSGR